MNPLTTSLVAAGALAVASALLSLVVVLRRWSFAAEGIGHSGFGGAGVAWLAALVFPSLDVPALPYAAMILACLLTAVAIGRVSRGGRVSDDAAVGVFLVASLAFGFLAQAIYHARRHAMPSGFTALLFGQMGTISPAFAIGAVASCLCVVVVMVLLGKEIIAYAFDPLAARTSGVHSGFVHDLLMILLAVVIVVGSRVAGSVLVVALLVLPGTTALLISRNLRTVVIASVVVAVIGTSGGILISHIWPMIPAGPGIVLVMVCELATASMLSEWWFRPTWGQSGGVG